ncbi:WD40 repeat domain-containing protein [Chloropicon primus]|uniref:WD40 repeat domain-containing protein n=3 Tax=Chloropicon primus TaxID=1764295 RepID=A0A5B8MI14_9CHLO|nr:WD40 repeat domain-containing protein [Chloropicon primus]UPQ99289.1 WD40 repeat domain-containing protein [Chloropicon primus]|eukprot:QDZ20077.1 WD40 repeat domain-containing protein [Chloropicon primus]
MACLNWTQSECGDARGFLEAVTRGRECSVGSRARKRRRELHLAESLVRKFESAEGSTSVLRGHRGCVNRLCWSETGRLLASVSDDLKIFLWKFPQCTLQGAGSSWCIPTNHKANIFGVKFLPLTNDAKIVTGAMDCEVQLHHLERGWESGNSCHTTTLEFHNDRVKAVEVEPCNPNNFWSGSEDGTVLQFDCRCLQEPAHLVTCRAHGAPRPVEVKFVSINPVRPYQLATACGDEYVRVYDRRMLSRSDRDDPLMKLTPPHLAVNGSERKRLTHTTCVSFGSTGRRLVASYHGDHCYSFDLDGEGRQDAAFEAGGRGARRRDTAGIPWGSISDTEYHDALVRMKVLDFLKNPDANRVNVPPAATAAIRLLSRGLVRYPNSRVLLEARADAFIARKWKGDASFALRDIERAMALQPGYGERDLKLIVAFASALHQLQQHESARYLMERHVKGKTFSDTELRGLVHLRGLQESVEAALEERGSGGRGEGSSPFLYDDDNDGEEDEGGEGEDGQGHPRPGGSTEEDDEEILRRIRGDELSTSLWARESSRRMSQRYVSQANNQTDTKEVSFLGNDDSIVASGSDDGNVMLFDSFTGKLLHYLEADVNIVNCVQCHPQVPCLATSGLEHVVRLWEPRAPHAHRADLEHPGDSKMFVHSTMMKMVLRNQEQNNENHVRPLFSLADIGENQRAIFRALADRFGTTFQADDEQCRTV